MDDLIEFLAPIGLVAGIIFVFYKMIWSFSENEAEDAEPEEEETDEEINLEIEADTVAKQINTNRNSFVYNRLRGDLERVQHIQSELDKVEELITQTESFHFMNSDKLEKNLIITAPRYSSNSGEVTTYNLDLYNNPHSREIALNLLYSERDRLATTLLSEITKISGYAVTESVTKSYNLAELRGVVDSVLREVKGA